MKIVVAPDSFKECMASPEVAACMVEGVKEKWPGAEVREVPLADGGEGTLDILASAMRARPMQADVHDPLGRPVTARYSIAGETAIIEVAQAIGLSLLKADERNPLTATSAGLGELLIEAHENGCRHFLVALGGTATCDGGEGMLNVPGIERLKDSRFEILCDVEAPFIGPKGAARVFAPQKGASPRDVEILEARLTDLARELQTSTGVDVANLPGAGAAGGLGGAFMAFFRADKRQGIARILDLVGFSEAIQGADLILTGEGKSDAQTLMGKVPMGVLGKANGIPVALLSGRIEDREALAQAGFGPILEISPRSIALSEAMKPQVAADNIRRAVLAL